MPAQAVPEDVQASERKETTMEGPTFYWGIGIENCWMAEHTEQNRPSKRLLDVYLLMQHYTMWREDLDKAAELGVKAIRYSVPWYRANPRPGVYDWSWISQPLDYMVHKLNIIPVIDLIHYGTPTWMENGVFNNDYAQRFADYTTAFARQFRGLVTHYTPHNEPQLGATYAGLNAYWPPYLTGLDGWAKVGLNIGKGMMLVSQALRAELKDAVLISADCLVNPAPADVEDAFRVNVRNGPADVRATFEYQVLTFPSSMVYGMVPPHSAFGQALINAGATEQQIAWFHHQAQVPDIVGCNYYPVCFDQPGVDNTTGVIQGQQELQRRLQQAATFFKRPVYVTETSAGYNDAEKGIWMQAAYDVIRLLRAQGVAVVGMNWWPLFETVQWAYRDTTKTVMECIYPGGWNNALFTIKEEFDGTLTRVHTGAADMYRNLIAAHPQG